jgi:hypothetical protein
MKTNIDTPKSPQEPSSESPSTSCSDSFGTRLSAAIAFRQTEIGEAENVASILADPNHVEHRAMMMTAVNQLTAGLGLCYLAGMTLEEMLTPWVKWMESAHPEIIGQNVKSDPQPTGSATPKQG